MSVLSDTQLEIMRRRLAEAGIAAPAADAPTPERADSGGLLGIAERRMWKIYQIDPDSDAHNFAVRLEFGPTYSIDTVVASAQRLITASHVLSSVIEVGPDQLPRRRSAHWDGRWVVPGEIWEWGVTAEPSALSFDDAAAVLARTPFRLTDEPSARVRIHQNASGGVMMVLVLHHLAGDETILPPVLSMLVSDNAVADTAAITTPTGTAVEPGGRDAADVDAALAHARSTWAQPGIAYPLSATLPTTSPEQSWRSALGEGPGRTLVTPVDATAVTRLGQFAREIGATTNALFVVVSALTVAAASHADDFVILVPADNRRPSETVSRVGYSGNIIPMRFSFDPHTPAIEAVRSAVSTVYAAMEHSAVDYGSILTPLRAGGGRFPVAEVMALVKNAPLRGVPVPERATVTCETISKDTVHYPLSIAVEFAADDSVHLEVEHRTDVVDDAAAQRITAIATTVIAALPQSPQVPLGELLARLATTDAT